MLIANTGKEKEKRSRWSVAGEEKNAQGTIMTVMSHYPELATCPVVCYL